MIKIGDARPAVGHERRAGLVRVPGRRALHERAVWARHLCAEETFVVGNAGRVSDSRKKQKKNEKRSRHLARNLSVLFDTSGV
jgi:hypothetical protein